MPLLCETVFPEAVNAAGLVGLMRKAEWVKTIHRLPLVLEAPFSRVLTADASAELLGELIDLAETPPTIMMDGKSGPLYSRFSRLRNCFQ